jgi:hypothetical protein
MDLDLLGPGIPYGSRCWGRSAGLRHHAASCGADERSNATRSGDALQLTGQMVPYCTRLSIQLPNRPPARMKPAIETCREIMSLRTAGNLCPRERLLACDVRCSTFDVQRSMGSWNACFEASKISVVSDLFIGTAKQESYGPPVKIACHPRLTSLRGRKAGYLAAS